MAVQLPALPYERDALAPYISGETLDFHHGKHHNAYVTNLNKAIAGTPRDAMKLEELIMTTDGGLFNNAAQVWNHTFYWNSMKKGGGGEPTGAVVTAIRAHFGTVADFRKQFKDAALSQFGSGWTWLVKDGEKLKITTTSNADLPMKHGQKALLTCDVWEHAYYIDHRNARGTYVDVYLDHLVNWGFIEQNLS